MYTAQFLHQEPEQKDRLSVTAREPTFTTFDAPGAVNGTFARAINPASPITGYL